MSRVYGWVQNPSDFSKLKLVVQIFDSTSTHYKNLKENLVEKYIPFDDLKNQLLEKLNKSETCFSYTELVGSSKDINGNSPEKRGDAVADSLIQISVLPQSAKTKGKMWTDNWTADGFLRWALTLNFVEHDRDTDMCNITSLGEQFSQSRLGSNDEKELLSKAILRYPPATRVLQILDQVSEPVTKYYIGSGLGFIGEKGFTSYSEKIMNNWFITGTDDDRKKIRSDIEGTSDKYARMISTWLEKLGYIEKKSAKAKLKDGREVSSFISYTITAKGKHALRQINGSSKNARVEKFLTWEFLATDGKNRDYLRTRRSYILYFLKETKSLTILKTKLEEKGFKDDLVVIKNDLKGLNYFGIRIHLNNNIVDLKDNIVDFSIPKIDLTVELKDARIEEKKAEFLNKTNIDSKYLELLEIAYNGKRNRDFEILTADLFDKIYGITTILMGGGRKPDAIAHTDNFGIIIDTKAYEHGYGKSITEEDKMVRYIEDNQYRDITRNSIAWWENFNSKIPNDKYYYMWVSSKFNRNFDQQLRSTCDRTSVNGCAINVEELLLGADLICKDKLDIIDLPLHMKNKEIIWKNIILGI